MNLVWDKMMKEKKAAKFCRLFLAQEKKRKKIKNPSDMLFNFFVLILLIG